MKKIDFSFDQVPGMSRIYAVPAGDLRALTLDPLSGFYRISLTTYANVIELPVYSQPDTSYNETQTVEDGCDRWDVHLSVFIPRHVNPALVRELERGEWIVLHQDANGDILASGTEEIPLLFTSARRTGGDTATGNYGEFSAVEPEPSLPISPYGFYIE